MTGFSIITVSLQWRQMKIKAPQTTGIVAVFSTGAQLHNKEIIKSHFLVICDENLTLFMIYLKRWKGEEGHSNNVIIMCS